MALTDELFIRHVYGRSLSERTGVASDGLAIRSDRPIRKNPFDFDETILRIIFIEELNESNLE